MDLSTKLQVDAGPSFRNRPISYDYTVCKQVCCFCLIRYSSYVEDQIKSALNIKDTCRLLNIKTHINKITSYLPSIFDLHIFSEWWVKALIEFSETHSKDISIEGPHPTNFQMIKFIHSVLDYYRESISLNHLIQATTMCEMLFHWRRINTTAADSIL